MRQINILFVACGYFIFAHNIYCMIWQEIEDFIYFNYQESLSGLQTFNLLLFRLFVLFIVDNWQYL